MAEAANFISVPEPNPKHEDADGVPFKEGDVIQINPDHRLFPCCIGVVTKAAAWGCQADIYGHSKELYPGRFASNEFVLIGPAKWIFKE